MPESSQAREAWYDFYHAVRALRRIRQGDQQRYKQFSFEYWRSIYRHEPFVPGDRMLTSGRKRRLP